MRIISLKIHQFKNIKEICLQPHSFVNFFVGGNGQGKTNILESLFLLFRGHSFRSFSTPQTFWPKFDIQKKFNPLIIGKIVDSLDQINDLSLEISEKKNLIVQFNQKKTLFKNLRKKFPVVAFSPEDHSLIRGSPDLRRHFLDRVFCDISSHYESILENFEKALKQRNRLLKNISEGRSKIGELKVWNETFAEHAINLSFIRKKLWPEFSKRVLRQASQLSKDFQTINLEFYCDVEHYLKVPLENTNDTKELLLNLLQKEMNKDLVTGWTHRGPQRDDFGFFIYDVIDSRSGASQGQARLLALSLRWAHAEWISDTLEEKPIVIIDDFSSELDASHRDSLLGYLKSKDLQLFISGTDPKLVDSIQNIDYKKYKVTEGSVNS